ncbi:MAG: hypothetical protein ABR505_09190 [Actinomycetota bacterium]
MTRRLVLSLLIISLVGIASGCAEDGSSNLRSDTPQPSFPPQVEPYNVEIDPADFVAKIDNPYLPLLPGTTHVYKGASEGETETVIVAVTRKTKEVLGVTCTVVRDVARVEGEIVEKTFDWFAQDRYGNVWYFGENSLEYENGEPAGRAGSWEAGVDRAQPGIVMLGDPQIGDVYRQEYYLGEAEDMGEVLALDASVQVPFGSFSDVLVTADTTPLEPNVLEHKFYARGVGVVLERSVQGPKGKLELIEVRP